MAAQGNPDAVDDRPRKRTRTSLKCKARNPTQHTGTPRLFAPFRALGIITNHIPFYLQTRSHKGATDGPRIHIVTCLGKSWALWEGGKMTLLFVGKFNFHHKYHAFCNRNAGPEATDPLSCVVIDGDAVWGASGVNAIKYIRGKEVCIFVQLRLSPSRGLQVCRATNPLGTTLASISLFGSQLLALTKDGTRMLIWDVSSDGM